MSDCFLHVVLSRAYRPAEGGERAWPFTDGEMLVAILKITIVVSL